MSSESIYRRCYESFAAFVSGPVAGYIVLAGFVVPVIVLNVTKIREVFGVSFIRIASIWFFSGIGLILLGGFLGWDEIAERRRLDKKLKPIPASGKKIELYDIETGQPLGEISEPELKYLIDSYQEWGMGDNDFYILRETIELFEERGVSPHLIVTLREMMGQKHDMEIGWTRV